MDKIVDKIRKLMAIANDPSASDQEIQLATYRANKLMLKHKITELELNEDNNGDIIQKTTNQYYTGYLYWTFRNICKYNRVNAYYLGKINSKCQLERTIIELKECYNMNIDKKCELILTDLHPAVVDYVKEKMKIRTLKTNYTNESEDAYELGLKEGSKYNLQDNNKQKHIDLNMHRSSSYE